LTARWSGATGRWRGRRGWLELEAVASVDVAIVLALVLPDAVQLLGEAASGRCAVAAAFGFILSVAFAVAWLVSTERLAQLLREAAVLTVRLGFFSAFAFARLVLVECLAWLAGGAAWLAVRLCSFSADARVLGVALAGALGESVDRVGVDALVAKVSAACVDVGLFACADQRDVAGFAVGLPAPVSTSARSVVRPWAL